MDAVCYASLDGAAGEVIQKDLVGINGDEVAIGGARQGDRLRAGAAGDVENARGGGEAGRSGSMDSARKVEASLPGASRGRSR